MAETTIKTNESKWKLRLMLIKQMANEMIKAIESNIRE
jgi:hypothetical protein